MLRINKSQNHGLETTLRMAMILCVIVSSKKWIGYRLIILYKVYVTRKLLAKKEIKRLLMCTDQWM